MFRLLLGLFGVELRYMVRRATTTALLYVIGGLLVGLSSLAFLLAIFIALADRYDALTAALIIGGFTLVLGLILLLIAMFRGRRRQPARGLGAYAGLGAVPSASPLTPPVIGPEPPPKVSTVLTIAAGAALVGLILGRRV